MGVVLLAAGLLASCASSGGEPPSEGLTDDWISAEVRRRIADEEELAGVELRVETTDRVVVITGIVTSLEQARTALRLAGRVRGVEQVVNRLRVIPDGGEAGGSGPGSSTARRAASTRRVGTPVGVVVAQSGSSFRA